MNLIELQRSWGFLACRKNVEVRCWSDIVCIAIHRRKAPLPQGANEHGQDQL
jgi:hypothetical protein